MKRISEHVYVETGIFACNLGLITTEAGNICIDSPHLAADAIGWRDRVQEMGEVKYTVITEGHPDHADCACIMPGTMVSHQNTRRHLEALPDKILLDRHDHIDPDGAHLRNGFCVRLSDITFSEGMRLHLGGLRVELLHMPGHSDGNIGVYIPEDKVVFASDTVFYHAKSWLHEATPHQWIASLENMAALDAEILVPGHGEVCTTAYLKEQAQIIQSWIDVVRNAIEKGFGLEEAKARIECPDPYPKQAHTPFTVEVLNEKIISRLYDLYKAA